MRITYKGDYALKAVLDLALHYDKGLVTIHDLASRIDAPIKFLEQVLLDLKRGGFVESKRGKIGGYQLSKPPHQVVVGDVVRFIDGSVEPIACTAHGYSDCKDLYKCIFRPIWQQVARATSEIIDRVTFEELANRMRKNQHALTYAI